jgi:signal transduction histidine kinase
MLMSAELVARIGPLNERQRMLISQIAVSAGRATELLDQLVDLTRARLGAGLQLFRVPMNMAFVARQLVEEMRASHPGRIFTVDVSGDTEGEWDQPRIGQIFSNLLGNAVRYGFSDLPVKVVITGEPAEMSISVHNDGISIPATAVRGIFDALVRGSSDENAIPSSNSLGLGLYITKEVVAAHGGTIKVTSSEKGGTTFTARFRAPFITPSSHPSEMYDKGHACHPPLELAVQRAENLDAVALSRRELIITSRAHRLARTHP